MSVTAILPSNSMPQAAPVTLHHGKRAHSAQPGSTSQTGQTAVTPGSGNAQANYHGVSGASGTINTHA